MNNVTGFTNTECMDMFRDYFNNFLTLEVFANYYSIDRELADLVIITGRYLHNKEVPA